MADRKKFIVLTEDAIDEILVRLPVKSIIRFKSVCKPWKSKFHSTSFKEFYYQQSVTKSDKKIVHTMKLEHLHKIATALWDSDNPKRRREFSAIGPLNNGIYCLTSFYMFFVTNLGLKLALCNPSNRHFKLLPPIPTPLQPILARSTNNRVVFGFDRVPCSSDYRVVVVINQGEGFLVLVYSTNSDKWERLVDYIPGEKTVGPPSATCVFTQRIGEIVEPMEVCAQKFLNGCWHWVVRYDQYFAILSFNFANQSFSIIKGPNIGVVHAHRISDVDVVVLHDHLVVIDKCRVSVWMMMDYNVEESWTIKFKASAIYIGLYALYRIDYSVLQANAGEEGGNDDIFTERLFFTPDKYSRTQEIMSVDRHGDQVTTFRYHSTKDISFNTGGISSYNESLEHLC